MGPAAAFSQYITTEKVRTRVVVATGLTSETFVIYFCSSVVHWYITETRYHPVYKLLATKTL